MPGDDDYDDWPNDEDRVPSIGHQNLAASVMRLESSYRDLVHFTGGIIATLAIERNQSEFAKIPVFHEMAKKWVERYRIQFNGR
jgi:hypothetical protein